MTPTHYRSLTSGDVLSAEDLILCEDCGGYEDTTCPNCGGTGKLEGYGVPPGDNYAPRRVVVVQDPLMEESAS